MQVDNPEKKRKVEEETKELNVDEVLKTYIDTNTDIARLLATLTQKLLAFEKMFNKDLFK